MASFGDKDGVRPTPAARQTTLPAGSTDVFSRRHSLGWVPNRYASPLKRCCHIERAVAGDAVIGWRSESRWLCPRCTGIVLQVYDRSGLTSS